MHHQPPTSGNAMSDRRRRRPHGPIGASWPDRRAARWRGGAHRLGRRLAADARPDAPRRRRPQATTRPSSRSWGRVAPAVVTIEVPGHRHRQPGPLRRGQLPFGLRGGRRLRGRHRLRRADPANRHVVAGGRHGHRAVLGWPQPRWHGRRRGYLHRLRAREGRRHRPAHGAAGGFLGAARGPARRGHRQPARSIPGHRELGHRERP